MQNKKNSKKNNGFTLVELLVVIAIVAFLSSIVLASLSSSRNKSKIATIQRLAVELRSEQNIFFSTNGDYGTESGCPTLAGNTSGFSTTNGLRIVTDLPKANPIGTALNCQISTDKANWVSWMAVEGTSASPTKFICIDGKQSLKLLPVSAFATWNPNTTTYCP